MPRSTNQSHHKQSCPSAQSFVKSESFKDIAKDSLPRDAFLSFKPSLFRGHDLEIYCSIHGRWSAVTIMLRCGSRMSAKSPYATRATL